MHKQTRRWLQRGIFIYHTGVQETGRIWDTCWRCGVRVGDYSGEVCACSWVKWEDGTKIQESNSLNQEREKPLGISPEQRTVLTFNLDFTDIVLQFLGESNDVGLE